MRLCISILIIGAALMLGGCSPERSAPSSATSSAPAESQTTSHYRETRPSQDGTGKIYMGREISHVMGHLGAGWLERPQREREEGTDLLIQQLPLDPDHILVDIGAGTGYFSFPMAQRVPDGKVIAVDIQQEMLDIIETRKDQRGVLNIETRLGEVSDPGLQSSSVDMILIVDAYHEFSHPREMGLAIADSLRSGGKLILIEYRAEDPAVPIKRLHKMSEDQARKEMAAVGLNWVKTANFLPQQHFLVFQKK